MPLLKKSFFSILLCLHFFISCAQTDSTAGRFSVSARLHYGFLIAHRPSIVPLQQSHLGGAEISVSKISDGSKQWHSLYNFARLGIKYCYFSTGNPDQLGHAHSLIPYIEVEFGKQKKLNFGMQWGWGIGYVEKAFDMKNNYKQVAIGSGINGSVNINFNLKYKITDKDFLYSGIGLTHFSNGSFVTPNLGINLATAQLSYSRIVGSRKKIEYRDWPAFKKNYRTSFVMATTSKQNYPIGRKNFAVAIFTSSVLKHYSPKAAAGFGIDLPYDDGAVDKLERRGDEIKPFLSGFRPGINASYEMIISDFSFMFQQGVYIYTQLKDDGYLYQRLGMRYLFSKHFFGAINLKTHFAKADYFEFGIGIKL